MADQGWGSGGHDDRQPPAQGPPPTVPFPVPPPYGPPPYGPPPYGPPPAAPHPGHPHAPPSYQPYAAYPFQPMIVYQPVVPVLVAPPRSKAAAALLAFFLGVLGVHNFYLGRNGIGVAQLLLATVGGFFTCGLLTVVVAFWAFVEFIVILCGGINDGYGRPLA